MKGLKVWLRLDPRSWLIGLYADRTYDDLVDVWIGFGPIWVVAEWRSKDFR